MVDRPFTLPEPARCLLRALWTWYYDSPKRLDDATAHVAAGHAIPKYLIRALAEAMMPGRLNPDKAPGAWALLHDSKLLKWWGNDGRRRPRFKFVGGNRYGSYGPESLQSARTPAPGPWRPRAVPAGRWSWNGRTIEIRAVPNGDVGSSIVVAVDGSKRFESAIQGSNPELVLVRLSDAGLDVASRSLPEEAPAAQPEHVEMQGTSMNELFDRIRAAQPDPLVLSDDDFDRLDAYLKTSSFRVSYADQQRAARGDVRLSAELAEKREQRRHLKFTLQFNRNQRERTADGDENSPTAQPSGADQTDSGVGTSPVTTQKRGRGGRKPDSDFGKDRRIAEAWASRRFETYAELDREFGLPQGDAKLAVDRHRHRVAKKPRNN